MPIFTPIIPLEFDASFSYIQRIMCMVRNLNEQGKTVNEIITEIEKIEGSISQQIKDEIFKEFQNSGNLKTALEHRKILIVGDSYTYGSGLADRSERFAQLIKNKGFDVTDISSPGGGFLASGDNGTFLSLINNFESDDLSLFTDVFFLGGINDTYIDLSNIHANIQNTLNVTHEKFVNAKLHVGYISQTQRLDDGGCNYEKTMQVKQAYREVSLNGICCYINNSEYILKQIGVLQNDGVHPNESGHQLIANYLISYILNGTLSVTRWANGVLLNYNKQVTSGAFNVNQTVVNNLFTINQPTNSVYAVDNIGITFNGSDSIVLGDMIDGLAFGQADGLNQFGPVNFMSSGVITYGTTSDGENITKTMPISIRIVASTVFIAPINLDNASTFTKGFVRQINLAPWSFSIPSDMI